MQPQPALLIEPFCGGGITALSAVQQHLVRKALMVELDPDVAAVWTACLGGDAERLAKAIMEFPLGKPAVEALLASTPSDTVQRALRTIVVNRVNRGGIMAPGAGLLKTGENNRGLASRWYPETLAARVCFIGSLREQIEFRHGDAFEVIREYCERPDVAFFVDPPYTAGKNRAGARLYLHNEIDHPALFAIMGEVAGNLVLTYDVDAEVIKLAQDNALTVLKVPMRTTHHRQKYELVISNQPWAIPDLYQMVRPI